MLRVRWVGDDSHFVSPETAGWSEVWDGALSWWKSQVCSRQCSRRRLRTFSRSRSKTRNSQFGLVVLVFRATTTAVYVAAPVRDILDNALYYRGYAVAQWLRHCTTNWKVAGSIPEGVTEFLRLHNPSGRTMDLWSTQPLTEISTRNIYWG
jgi:hypothetical protein